MKNYDIIIIGSGGGTKLVRPVAKKGYKVAIIEKEKLGGTCLNRGCIPSKMLIHAADVAMAIKEAHKYQLQIGSPEVLFDELVTRVCKKIDEESESIRPVYEKDENITLYNGHVKFISNTTVEVNGETLSSDKIVIATGADAAVPDLKGLSDVPYMTYRDALRNTNKPKKLLVIGGGYIATELGYFYGALGVETHFFVRSMLLRKEDSEIREEFDRAFSKQFHVHKKITLKEVSHKDGIFTLSYEDENKSLQKMEADALLVAIGVAPNTKELGLENTDVTLDERGYVKVDPKMQTDAKGIYAIGDCVGRFLFRHSVNFEGEYLERLLFQKQDEPIKYRPMPHAVFTYPQVAGVGVTEDTLKEKNIPYVKGFCKYSDSAMGMALLSEYGFAKLLFHKETKKLLGAHIIGDEASVMIHMLIAFMNMDASLEDLLDMIYIHPALPEVVRNAARDAQKQYS
ncbi:dihydrolipoamide dehydrogenase [Candidatus Aerophobetes bacterium]|uniref:Dihydrolipoamide dehydrogenase n=1 Tax=Aerophobetes bacterium TaxID=2030807 RepID=A0A2A4YLY3_UNCAE|nr:MAG: dihydrolipoamide dehydrogenase [Candidatus Aerophobetes bacterium]